MTGRALAFCAALALAGCGLDARYSAAEGVRAFLSAVERGDRRDFEARLDRPRLAQDIRRQLAAASPAGEPAGSVIADHPRADLIIQSLITPESFRLAVHNAGVRRLPSALEITPLVRMQGPDAACLSDPRTRACALTFRRLEGTWKLVGLHVAPGRAEPPSKV